MGEDLGLEGCEALDSVGWVWGFEDCITVGIWSKHHERFWQVEPKHKENPQSQ